MLALAAASGCVATDPAFSPTASYSSDLSTSGDMAMALPETVDVLPMPSGRADDRGRLCRSRRFFGKLVRRTGAEFPARGRAGVR